MLSPELKEAREYCAKHSFCSVKKPSRQENFSKIMSAWQVVSVEDKSVRDLLDRPSCPTVTSL